MTLRLTAARTADLRGLLAAEVAARSPAALIRLSEEIERGS